jgi:ubiquinone/menaquinone biosynthesis C-methylase UbiE
MNDNLIRAVIAEYETLGPLQVRIDTHRRFSARPDTLEADTLAHSRLDPAHDVLDVGSGTGEFLATRRGHTGRLVAVDTSEAAVAKAREIPGVEGILGSAVDLPLPDDSFDRLFARHMLYHIETPAGALHEFARVTRAGGLVIAVVNHRSVVPHLMDLVGEEVARHVTHPAARAAIGIHSENLPAMMSEVFGNVESFHYDNHLEFATPEPMIRFAGAVTSMCGLPPDAPERDEVLHAIAERAHAWFASHVGPWRDPKGYSVNVSVA